LKSRTERHETQFVFVIEQITLFKPCVSQNTFTTNVVSLYAVSEND